jgi:ArsR family transcriptional regulator, cadmium/lead-responsive transcriptional repressor
MFTNSNPKTIDLQARFFRGFSDASRLAILQALHTAPRTVSEIVTLTGLTQPNVSNHLACLRDCGLVNAEQNGRFTRYQLSDPRVAELLSLAESLVADVAKSMYECTHYPNLIK